MTSDEARALVAANIRRLAAERGTTINELADAAEIDRSGLYRVLRRSSAVTVDRLARLATALDADMAEFFAAVPAAASSSAGPGASPSKKTKRKGLPSRSERMKKL